MIFWNTVNSLSKMVWPRELPVFLSLEHYLYSSQTKLRLKISSINSKKNQNNTKDEKLKDIPEIPATLREQLKREVREEILGRKSAQDLIDLGRKARPGTKRTQTSPDLREAIKKRKVDSPNSDDEDSNILITTPSMPAPLLPATSISNPSKVSPLATSPSPLSPSKVSPLLETSPSKVSPLLEISKSKVSPLATTPTLAAISPSKSKEIEDIPTQKNSSILTRALSTPVALNVSGEIPVFTPRKLLPQPQIVHVPPPSSPSDNSRVIREIQALRSIIAGMQKEIDQLKDTVKKKERQERNSVSDIIKMKAEISMLTANLNSCAAIQRSNDNNFSLALPVLKSLSNSSDSETASENPDSSQKVSLSVSN